MRPGAAGVAAQLDAMLASGHLTPAERKAVSLESIEFVLSCELAPLLRGERGPVFHEAAMYLPDGDAADAMDRRMIRGRIDVLIDTPEGPVILDYKTDNVHGEKLRERIATHSAQLNLYRAAVEKVTGRRCAGVYLLFVNDSVRRVVEVLP